MAHGTFSERDFLFVVLAVFFVIRLHLVAIVDGTRSRRGAASCIIRKQFSAFDSFVSDALLEQFYCIRFLVVLYYQRMKSFQLARASLLFIFPS